MHPLIILLLGTSVVLIGIVGMRIGAFFSLILAAFTVSLLAPGEYDEVVGRAVEAFGTMAGKISVIIACAAVIGKCMMDSGAADRIVRAFLGLFGEKRAPLALMGSGFVLSVPVFFDTVFYLLIPLARSLHAKTKRDYLLYILAIAGGAAITHTLVPPTPGPLAMAENLGFDVGLMMLVGIAVSTPCAFASLLFAKWIQGRLDLPMRPLVGEGLEDDETDDAELPLPGLFVSSLPIALPVLMISANTVVSLSSGDAQPGSTMANLARVMNVVGNPNVALLLSAAIAVVLFVTQRRPSRDRLEATIESALMSAGIIILITAAGGAFGEMLKAARVGPVIQEIFSGGGKTGGITLILLGWLLASLLKISQGSSTVAMIASSSILASMIDPATLTVHPVYLATAIGSGSLCVSWMNDSGFWIVAKMSGMTELEALRTWTAALIVLSLSGLLLTIALALLLPMGAVLPD